MYYCNKQFNIQENFQYINQIFKFCCLNSLRGITYLANSFSPQFFLSKYVKKIFALSNKEMFESNPFCYAMILSQDIATVKRIKMFLFRASICLETLFPSQWMKLKTSHITLKKSHKPLFPV